MKNSLRYVLALALALISCSMPGYVEAGVIGKFRDKSVGTTDSQRFMVKPAIMPTLPGDVE